MADLVFASALQPGEMLDLEGDIWADSPTSMLTPSRYAGEYSIVEAVKPADEEWVDVTLESGETIAFPEDYQVKRVPR